MVHSVGIELDGDAPDTTLIERELHTPINEAVKIAPLGGIKTGMPVLGHNLGVEHGNRFFDHVKVHGIAKFVGADFFGKVHMCDLAEGMNARVGAARAINLDGLALV